MALNIKSLLKDKKVLYVVMFMAVTNFFAYLIMHKWTAAIIFALIAYLTTYFSKNMIVVLLVAVISTNIIVTSRVLKVVEGMENQSDEDKSENKKESNEAKENASSASTQQKQSIDYKATVEKAYEDLDELIGKDSIDIDKMTQDTSKLVQQQDKLLQNLENMTPFLETAGKLLEKFPAKGMGDMQGTISNVVESLRGLKK